MNVLQAPIPGAGFTPAWPYAQSMPLPSAILRPLQQPIFDTEILIRAVALTEKIYFQRQLGQSDAGGGIAAKQDAHTNLQQPGQLANPLEFSLFGFLFEVDCSTTLADFIQIYKCAVFTFTYTGNRVYLSIPLPRIPQGVSPEGYGYASGYTVGTLGGVIHNGVGHISNIYKFTIGRSALRIRPTESFQAKLRWQLATGAAATPQTATPVADVMSRVYLIGLSWVAL
jgi:hypothetical protein